MKVRYAIYRYSQHIFAIDCEDCNRKICNLTPSEISGEIMDKINEHERKRHAAE
jgi:hypothetical protein